MIDWTAYRTSLRAAVGAVWPEVLPDNGGGGIETHAQAERIPLEATDAPFAAILLPAAVRSEEWSGLTNDAFLQDVTFCYVARLDQVTDMEEHVAERCRTLERFLRGTGLSHGQFLWAISQDAGAENAVNAVILDKQKPFHAGALTARILVGETND